MIKFFWPHKCRDEDPAIYTKNTTCGTDCVQSVPIVCKLFTLGDSRNYKYSVMGFVAYIAVSYV